MINVKVQLIKQAESFKNAFAELISYNGLEITAIHEQGETNKKEGNDRGTSDKEYFSLSVEDVKPQINDEIVYLGDTYRIIRITGKNGGFVQVETNKHNSIYPKGR